MRAKHYEMRPRIPTRAAFLEAPEKKKAKPQQAAWPLGLKFPVGGKPPVARLLGVTGGRARLRRHRLLFLCASTQAQGAGGHGYDHDQFNKFHH
jgi:hypothetical protein